MTNEQIGFVARSMTEKFLKPDGLVMSKNSAEDNCLDLCLTPGNKLYDFFSVTKREILKDAGISIDVIVKMNLDEAPDVATTGKLLWAFMEEWAKSPEEDRTAGALEVLDKAKNALLTAKAVADGNNGVFIGKAADPID